MIYSNLKKREVLTMKVLVLAASLGVTGLTFAQSKAPVATVASSAAITVQGVEAPVAGSTAWPVSDGDVIQTSSASAEVRLKDGTRIYVPPSSRFVVGTPLPPSKAGARADLRVRAVTGAPDMSSKRTSKGAESVIAMLDGGAMVINESTLQQFAAASSFAPRIVPGDTPALISLTELAKTFGPGHPIIATLASAMNTPGAVITPGTGGGFTITLPGGQGTIVIAPTIITVTTPSGTVTFTPPAPGTILGCKGGVGVSPNGSCQ